MVKETDYRLRAADYRLRVGPSEVGNAFLLDNKTLTDLTGSTAPFPFPRFAGPRCPKGETFRRFCLRTLDPVKSVKSVKYKKDKRKVITDYYRPYRFLASLGSLSAAKAFVAGNIETRVVRPS